MRVRRIAMTKCTSGIFSIAATMEAVISFSVVGQRGNWDRNKMPMFETKQIQKSLSLCRQFTRMTRKKAVEKSFKKARPKREHRHTHTTYGVLFRMLHVARMLYNSAKQMSTTGMFRNLEHLVLSLCGNYTTAGPRCTSLFLTYDGSFAVARANGHVPCR